MYATIFERAIDRLQAEGRYRVFIGLSRIKGAFPDARCFAGHNGSKLNLIRSYAPGFIFTAGPSHGAAMLRALTDALVESWYRPAFRKAA